MPAGCRASSPRLHETGALAGQIGWWAVIGIVLRPALTAAPIYRH
jgi:hypothetical protein